MNEAIVSKEKIAGRLKSGLALTGLGQIILAATTIALVPLFIAAWDVDGYGRWLSLTAVIAYLGLLDLGGQNYVGNLLAGAYTRGDEVEFRTTLAKGVSLFGIIALASLGVLSIVVSWPSLTLPGQTTALNSDDRLVLFAMGAALLLLIPQGVFVSSFRATGQYHRGMLLGVCMRFLLLLSYVGMLLVPFEPAAYAVGYLIGQIILTLAVVVYAHRIIPITRNLPVNLRAANAGRTVLLKGSLFFWLIMIAAALNQQGVILVLTAYVPAALIALYATHRTAAGLLGYISNLFLAPIWPEMSFLYAKHDQINLNRLTQLSIRVVVCVSALGAVALWLILPAIYSLWTDQQLTLQPALLAIFLLQGILAAGWYTTGWPMLAANQHRRLAMWALANAMLTVVLAIIFARLWGVIGVALATLTGDVVCGALVYPRLSARFLQVSVWEIVKAIVRPLLVVLAAGALIVAMSGQVGDPIVGLGLGLVLGMLALYPTVWLALGRNDFNWLKQRLLGVPPTGTSQTVQGV